MIVSTEESGIVYLAHLCEVFLFFILDMGEQVV
jgi:hypothetical protein